MDGNRPERLAKNEAVFRDVNERVKTIGERLEDSSAQGLWDFLCECSNPECLERLKLTLPEYERVRSSPLRFAVAPGHEVSDVERVVEASDRFVVIEKTTAEATAETTHPRE